MNDNWSGKAGQVIRVNGSSDSGGYVEALERLGMGFVRLADTIHESYEGNLRFVVEERSRRPHLYTEEGVGAEVRGYWREFLHAVDELLTRGFKSLVDSAVDPKYAKGMPAELAYERIDLYYSQIKRNAGLRIVPLVLTLDSGQTIESLSAEFKAINHHLMNLRGAAFRKQAEVQPPPHPTLEHVESPTTFESTMYETAGLSDPPQPQPTVENVEPLTTPSPVCRFGLADLSDPPYGVSKHQVVNELFRLLRDTIKKARSLVDQETTKGNKMSPKDIAERFLLLKDAIEKELRECVFEGRHIPANKAAFDLMAKRTGIDIKSIKSYTYKQPTKRKRKRKSSIRS